MNLLKKKLNKRIKLKKTIKGTKERPRLSVFRSNNHIYAQVIDDNNFMTLASYSTLNLNKKDSFLKTNTCEGAKIVGKKLAELCIKKNINKVIFDKGVYIYHGRVKALADSARFAGLLF
jgi:large subunit ribosomal protein L18